MAVIQGEQIRRAIRGRLRRAMRGGAPVALADVERWALARYPDDLDEAYARRLVREIGRTTVHGVALAEEEADRYEDAIKEPLT